MKKKIIFWQIKNSPNERKFQYEEGIGAYKLSTIAKESGYETVVFQDHQFKANPEEIKKITESNSKGYNSIIAYSLLSNGVPLLKQLATRMNKPVLIGGAGATIEPERILKMFSPRVPVALVQGDAEPIFSTLLSTPQKDWYKIEGIWSFLPNGDVVQGKPFVLENLDEGPFVNLSASNQRKTSEHSASDKDLPLEKRLELLKSLTTSQIESRRGCYYKCGYCNNSCLDTKLARVRKSSPQRLVKEMENIFDNYGITFFSLTDNIAFDSLDWWKEFVRLMGDSRITPYIQFGGYSSPVFMNRPEWLKKLIPELYSVGLRGIILGVQAGSKRILKDIIHRHPKDPENALAVAKEIIPLGINLKIDFIIGHPTETLEDLEETRKWMKVIYEAGGEVFVRELQVVPNSLYHTNLMKGFYSLPERTLDFEQKLKEILRIKKRDDNYKRIAFSNGKIPNKYLIDRNLRIIYPSTIFDLQTLQENRRRLMQSQSPDHIKERYKQMFKLVIQLKKSKGYEF